MPNRNLPYPEDLQDAIDRYRRWELERPDDTREEGRAMAALEDACDAHSYDVNEVMTRERL